jgi:mono/diheme cytochrome c family protein
MERYALFKSEMRFQQVLMLGTLLLAGCGPSAKTPSPTPLAQAAADGPGARLYNEYCVMCHLDGKDAPSAPSLLGSPVLLSGPEATLRILLHGSVNQSAVNPGYMPPQKFFTDQEAADLTAYVRSAFVEKAEAVPPGLAAKIRAEAMP